RDFLAAVATIVGRRPPRIRVPIAPLYPLAVGAEAWARLTGREPFLTRDGLRMARHHMFFNDAKARGELGYSSRPYRDGLAALTAAARPTRSPGQGSGGICSNARRGEGA